MTLKNFFFLTKIHFFLYFQNFGKKSNKLRPTPSKSALPYYKNYRILTSLCFLLIQLLNFPLNLRFRYHFIDPHSHVI